MGDDSRIVRLLDRDVPLSCQMSYLFALDSEQKKCSWLLSLVPEDISFRKMLGGIRRTSGSLPCEFKGDSGITIDSSFVRFVQLREDVCHILLPFDFAQLGSSSHMLDGGA
ncbi:hypothetical protein Tco_1197634 [Tanacetum coccineum]